MLAADADKLDDRELRKSETLTADFDNQGGNNRKRKRNFDDKARTVAGIRPHVDGAADLLDIAADDVHADAAARDAGHRRGGGKTWSEDEIVEVGLGFGRYFGFDDETSLECLGIDARSIEAAAVVGDFDHDVTALPRSAQANGAAARLARGAALVRA